MLSKFVLAVAVASTASANLLDSSALSVRSLALHLERRQTTLDPSQFPDACRSICTPIINTLNTCQERPVSGQLDCLCTSSNGESFEGCVNCLVEQNPTTAMRQQGQRLLDQFDTTCAAYGLPKHTIDGGGNTPAPSTPANDPVPSPSVINTPTDPETVPPATVTVTRPPTTPTTPTTPTQRTVTEVVNPSASTGNNGGGNANDPFSQGGGGNGAASVVIDKFMGVILGAAMFASALWF